MPIDVETIPEVKRRRTIEGVELVTRAALDPANWRIKYRWEENLYDGETIIGPGRAYPDATTRRFADLADRVIGQVRGTDITGSDLAELIKTAGYAFLAEDDAIQEAQ